MTDQSEIDIQKYDTVAYYKVAFPFEELFKLFGQQNREFAFTSGEIYRRFLTFSNAKEFRNAVLAAKPDIIHIGAVYQQPFKDAQLNIRDIPIVGRELVFDVDITAYDEYRSCCFIKEEPQQRQLNVKASTVKSGVCSKCWGFCSVAMKILGYILKTMYGFKQVMYVFSGNKGFHAWVLDARAFNMTQRERLEILNLVKNVDKFISSKMPDVDVIYQTICEPLFPKMSSDYPIIFADLEKKCKMDTKVAILKFMWPRVDEGVTTGINHLLKMPLSLHPVTKNITWIIDEGSDLPPTQNCDVVKMMKTQREFYLRSHIPRNLDTKSVVTVSPFIRNVKQRR